MLKRDQTILTLIDVQGKLARLMHEADGLIRELVRLLRGLRALGVPVLWLEQNPAGLGPTVPEVAAELEGLQPIAKRCFSAMDCPAFVERLEGSRRRQVLLAGIETHVCVYQTAADLRAREFEVEVVADAVSSRTAFNKQIGLEKMRAMGVGITSVEMVLFELLRVAEGPAFKAILELVK